MTLLGQQSITRRRRAATTWGSDGRPVAGATTDTAILASVQVASGQDLQLLPEGYRSSEAIKVYTTSDLRVADQHSSLEADSLIYGGGTYQVQYVNEQHPLIQHHKVIAVRVSESLS